MTSTFRGRLVGKREVTFSVGRGGEGKGSCNLYIKDKLKSEIFNDKKSF